jgi:hypothetical protein
MIALRDHFGRDPHGGSTRRISIKARTAARLEDASCDNALTWEDGASRLRPPSDTEYAMQKARGRFPGAGSKKNPAMMKICR